jgi:amino acid adenylation domain-containing protein
MLDKENGHSLRSAFLRQSRLRPDSPAIVVRGNTRSYGELETTARRWASALIENVDHEPERVGLYAYRSETSYTGTLAALFAGATFVPLNPTFPAEKTAAMLQQADLDAIIVDKTYVSQLCDALVLTDSQPCLVIPELEVQNLAGVEAKRIVDKRKLAKAQPLQSLPPITPEDSAYLLFTSGSTGAPKGVPVAHANASYFMDFMSRRYGIMPDDRLSQTFDQTFDLSVFDLFMSWSNGACVYSMSSIDLLSPVKFINQNRITVWFSVPSVPAFMIRRKGLAPDTLRTLRWSLFCGEPLTQRCAEAWQLAAPNSILENLYGPTELTIACFVHRWDPISSPDLCRNGLVPIGRPFDGLTAMTVDGKLNNVGPGEPGELCVGGPQTTGGYWRVPEKTAERYVHLPVSRAEKRRFYRTGDLVARLPNGEYTFLGRADQQIKVLGHRVELQEVEAHLRRHPGVEHAVAFGWPPSGTTADAVVAFVSGSVQTTDELLSIAKSALPPYMVPRQVFILGEMPLNPNGKVDRRALESRLAKITG